MTNIHAHQMRLAHQIKRQMGDYAFVRFARNLGLSFEETYFLLFEVEPK
jgi:hypothetical protein